MAAEAILLGCICGLIVRQTSSFESLDVLPSFIFAILYFLGFLWPPLFFVFAELSLTTYFKRSILRGVLFATSFGLLLTLTVYEHMPPVAAIFFTGNLQSIVGIGVYILILSVLFAVTYIALYLPIVFIRGKDHTRSGWNCLKCGYDTTHIKDEAVLIRCPECGRHTGKDPRICTAYANYSQSSIAQIARKTYWILIGATATFMILVGTKLFFETRGLSQILSLSNHPELLSVQSSDNAVMCYTSRVSSEQLSSRFAMTHWQILVSEQNARYVYYLEPVALRNGFLESGWPLVQFWTDDLNEFDRFLRSESEMDHLVSGALDKHGWTATMNWNPNANHSPEYIILSDLLTEPQ